MIITKDTKSQVKVQIYLYIIFYILYKTAWSLEFAWANEQKSMSTKLVQALLSNPATAAKLAGNH